MAKREYSFYPGCSSQKGASSSNYLISVQTMCEELEVQLNEIPDWNCCAASIGYAGGGELPRLTLSARNIALSEQHHPGQDIVATCAACWLSTREAAERLHEDQSLLAECNTALAEAGLKLRNETPIKHMAEVLIEDLGYEALKARVKKPLEGIKIAGYVGCQTNRPFGIAGESYENPKYLDKLVETLGGDSIPDYEKKVQCCGGALAFSEPEKSQEMVKGIIEAAYDHGADLIVTPCPVCQMNVEVYQDQINQTYGTKFQMPVVYYSTLMAVAYGRSAKDAALNGLHPIAHIGQRPALDDAQRVLEVGALGVVGQRHGVARGHRLGRGRVEEIVHGVGYPGLNQSLIWNRVPCHDSTAWRGPMRSSTRPGATASPSRSTWPLMSRMRADGSGE